MIFQSPHSFASRWLQSIRSLQFSAGPKVSLKDGEYHGHFIFFLPQAGVSEYSHVSEEGELMSATVVNPRTIAERIVEVVYKLRQKCLMPLW